MSQSILRRIAEGDQAAVRECISRHGGLVWSIARRGSANRSDAEDAVQEIFVSLWTNASRFDPAIASEATFIATIARRILIDRRRKLGRRPVAAPLPATLASDSFAPLDQLERLDEAGRAAEALRCLGNDQRTVLTLAIYRGMTYLEIAESTGQPLGTIKSLARRGLIKPPPRARRIRNRPCPLEDWG